MTIHHVDNEHLINLTYAEWFKDYLKTGKYSNYIVNSTDGVVELHKLNDKTNRFDFNMLVDDHVGKQFISREPLHYKIEPLSGLYSDKYLLPKKLTKGQRRKILSKKPNTIKQNETPTKNENQSRGVKFWQLISENKLISGIILLFLALFIKFLLNYYGINI